MTPTAPHEDANNIAREGMMSLVRPPVLATSTILNRAAFAQTFNIAAASVRDIKQMATIRKALAKNSDLLEISRYPTVQPDPDASLASKGRKCMLLKTSVSAFKRETWGPVISDLVKQDLVGLVPYELKLGYDYWSFRDVLTVLLPPELHEDIPSGFNTAGHVAHLNLRSQHLPYKSLIAEVLLDKNDHIRTVINKISDVGSTNEFRTFPFEFLAGPEDTEVEVMENGCAFAFDYAKVYWNSKLEGEHTRLMTLFRPGEVVCDVMAGIGPFAVPAGRRAVFVWANDYNPESYRYLKDAITRNKATPFVKPFNVDGRVFIHQAADGVLAASQAGEYAAIPPKRMTKGKISKLIQNGPTRVSVPPTISHFIMNLPDSATEFLRHFRGLYVGREDLFTPHTQTQLPIVHCHCFALKSDKEAPRLDVAERVSKELGVWLEWDGVIDPPGWTFDDSNARRDDRVVDGKVSVIMVREVAPKKNMYCASFRLPAEVAFGPRI